MTPEAFLGVGLSREVRVEWGGIAGQPSEASEAQHTIRWGAAGRALGKAGVGRSPSRMVTLSSYG